MANDVLYKTYRAEVKEINEDEGIIDMLIPVSTTSVDRDGEVIESIAFKKTIPKFMKHPVLVASHDYHDLTNQIGEWTKLKITEGGMEGKPKYYVNAGNEQADWAYYLASKGVAAFSIGFIPKVWEDGDGDKTPRRKFTEVELLEISQVIVPSNRDAIQSMRSKAVDPVIKEICDAAEKELKPEPPVEDKEIVTKPEETNEYIRIPVRECKITATIDISEKEGIKALYCGKEKEIATYLFLKSKGWTMEKAKKWVADHKKGMVIIDVSDSESEAMTSADNIVLTLSGTPTIGRPQSISQGELKDEFDYILSIIKTVGISDEVKNTAIAVRDEIMRLTGGDIPDEHTPPKEDETELRRAIVEETIKEIFRRRKINDRVI